MPVVEILHALQVNRGQDINRYAWYDLVDAQENCKSANHWDGCCYDRQVIELSNMGRWREWK